MSDHDNLLLPLARHLVYDCHLPGILVQTLGNAAVHFCGSRPSWWAGGALYQIISYYDHHHFLILINDNVDDDFSDANNVTGRWVGQEQLVLLLKGGKTLLRIISLFFKKIFQMYLCEIQI